MKEDTVRKPTAQELEQLKHYYMSTGQDEETANNILTNYWFAAFDSTISESPAYVGTLIVAVYGMIEFYEVFLLEKNKLKRIDVYCLNLEQTIHLTSVIHTAITMYMRRTLGIKRKTGYNRRRQNIRT